MLASSRELMNSSRRWRASSAWAGVIFLVLAASRPGSRRRFFGSAEGSMAGKMAWKQYRTRR